MQSRGSVCLAPRLPSFRAGEVAYLRGFGVKELGDTQPVTPDTLLMIGSITKPMTTMLAAALVDHGHLSWNTRLVDVLPRFAAGDRAMTERLTVRDAFCNCSGLPGRDLERYFKTGKLIIEETLTALAGVASLASFGEQFVYNNLLVAAGGYTAGVAARGGGVDDVGLVYDAAMQQRVLGPIGMKRSTSNPAAYVRTATTRCRTRPTCRATCAPYLSKRSTTSCCRCAQQEGSGRPHGRWHVSSKPSWPAASHQVARAWSPRGTWR
jgi:CubicO group peptidase (beta-lactamase class C family)